MPPFAPLLTVPALICLSLPLLLFVQFNTLLPPWGSRKVLHMGAGTLFILCDVHDPLFAAGMYAVAITTAYLVSRTRLIHFASLRDVGMLNYMFFCALCVTLKLPMVYIAPLFYADPMGAIVGRNVPSRKLVGSKSLSGTVAVFVTASLTFVETPAWTSLASGAAVAAIELFAGKWDNVAIGAYLLLHHAALRHPPGTTADADDAVSTFGLRA